MKTMIEQINKAMDSDFFHDDNIVFTFNKKTTAIRKIKKQPFFKTKIDFVFIRHWVTRQDIIDAGYRVEK